jgi:tryptophan synthase beta subunit
LQSTHDLTNISDMRAKPYNVNLSDRGDKDVAQVAAKVKLEMPK